jgi:hypothetical protein
MEYINITKMSITLAYATMQCLKTLWMHIDLKQKEEENSHFSEIFFVAVI